MPPVEEPENDGSIRILIADDHRLFRQGLVQICESKGGFSLIAEAENGQEAVELAHRLKPDVVLMDIRMPVLDGVQATSKITAADPEIPGHRTDHVPGRSVHL